MLTTTARNIAQPANDFQSGRAEKARRLAVEVGQISAAVAAINRAYGGSRGLAALL
jgi:hypothetical protein